MMSLLLIGITTFWWVGLIRVRLIIWAKILDYHRLQAFFVWWFAKHYIFIFSLSESIEMRTLCDRATWDACVQPQPYSSFTNLRTKFGKSCFLLDFWEATENNFSRLVDASSSEILGHLQCCNYQWLQYLQYISSESQVLCTRHLLIMAKSKAPLYLRYLLWNSCSQI